MELVNANSPARIMPEEEGASPVSAELDDAFEIQFYVSEQANFLIPDPCIPLLPGDPFQPVRKKMAWRELLEHQRPSDNSATVSSEKHTTHTMYYGEEGIDSPEFRGHLTWPLFLPEEASCPRRSIILSSAGSVIEWRRHMSHTCIQQLAGRRKVMLLSPREGRSRKAYPERHIFHEHLELRPEEAELPEPADNMQGRELYLEPGESLVIPQGWSYRTEALSTLVMDSSWWPMVATAEFRWEASEPEMALTRQVQAALSSSLRASRGLSLPSRRGVLEASLALLQEELEEAWKEETEAEIKPEAIDALAKATKRRRRRQEGAEAEASNRLFKNGCCVNPLHRRLNCLHCKKFWEDPAVDPVDDNDTLLVYCINLDRRPDRWAAFQPQLAKLGAFLHPEEGRLEVVRVSAIDGRERDLAQLDPAEILPVWRWDQCILGNKFEGVGQESEERKLTPGEIGCALSHVEVWRRIASQETRTAAIVFEDDALLDDDAAERLRAYGSQLPPAWDLTYLGGIKMGKAKRITRNVIVPECYLCTHGYMLTPQGAKRLLAQLPVIGPIDHFMSECFRDVNTFAFQPSLAQQPQHLRGCVESTDSDVAHTLERVTILNDKE